MKLVNILLLGLIMQIFSGCKKINPNPKNYEAISIDKSAILLTPKNDNLKIKLIANGCDTFYREVKNRILYNRNTGLYFRGFYWNTYSKCYHTLSITEFYQLYGPPHDKDENYLYYYSNVLDCGRYFSGFKAKINSDNKIIRIEEHAQANILPNKVFKEFVLDCGIVDYIDKEKMKVNQGIFEYFSDEFVNKHFEVADHVQIQPKYENSNLTERCLESLWWKQNNFVYNKARHYYMPNAAHIVEWFPLLDSKEQVTCQLAFNNVQDIKALFGEPSFSSKSSDTISYFIYNEKFLEGGTPNLSFVWNKERKTFFHSIHVKITDEHESNF